MKLNTTLVISLLLGLTTLGFPQGGNDQQGGGITVTGDPVQQGGSQDQNQGGSIVIPDEQDPLRGDQHSPAQAASNRDEEAHKRLVGHDAEIGKLNSDVASLRSDFEAYKAASKNERLAAYMGDNVRLTSARAKKSRARTALRKKGVSEKTFSEARLFKALEAALKSGKLDAILLERIDGFIADPKTKLGEMLVATQKIVSLELTLYGDKDNPTDDMAYRLENLEKWATTDQTLPFEPSKNYAATSTAPPAADTTPSAPADKGTSKPQGGTVPGEQAPPALKPQGGKNDESKQGLLPLGLPQSESAALIVVVGMISYGLITRRKRPAQ